MRRKTQTLSRKVKSEPKVPGCCPGPSLVGAASEPGIAPGPGTLPEGPFLSLAQGCCSCQAVPWSCPRAGFREGWRTWQQLLLLFFHQ